MKKKKIVRHRDPDNVISGTILRRSSVYGGGVPWYWFASSQRVYWIIQIDETQRVVPVLVIHYGIALAMGTDEFLTGVPMGVFKLQPGDRVTMRHVKPEKMFFLKGSEMMANVSGTDVQYKEVRGFVVVNPVYVVHDEWISDATPSD